MVTGCLPRVVMVTGYLHRVVSVTGFLPKVMMVAGCLPRVVMVTGFLPKVVMVTGYLPWASALHSEWSDRVAQLLERRIKIRSPEVRTPSGAQQKIVRVFMIQKYCADSLPVCLTPVCMRTHKNAHVRTLKIR